MPFNLPLDIIIDNSIFYQLGQILLTAGFKDLDGNPTIHLHQGPVESYLPVELEEDEHGGFDSNTLSALLPALCFQNDFDKFDPGALGGCNWEKRFYTIDIYGTSEQESREIAAIICEKILGGIEILDYNTEGNPSLGIYQVKNVTNFPKKSNPIGAIDKARRLVRFEMWNLRKSY